MQLRPKSPILLAALLVCLLAVPGRGQDEGGAGRRDENLPSGGTIRTNVNVVNLYYTVKDKHGALIPGLAKDDFEVLEDGKPQTIKYFTADAQQPLTLGVLLDTSVSQQRVLTFEQEAGARFLKDVLRAKDEAFLISFDVNVDLLADFTSSATELQRALARARINSGGGGGGLPGMGGGPFPTSTTPRGTLLFDAIWLASREKLAPEVGRKAMILLTDGEDQGSRETLKQAIEAAQKADAIVYGILVIDRGFYFRSGGRYAGDANLKKVAGETGGRVIEVVNDYKKLDAAFSQIANELRHQYSIGYTPTNNKLDGSFRKVEVRPKNNEYKVQARQGYYATSSPASD
jgi:VWFA-related protein